jgi:hypothetical protein
MKKVPNGLDLEGFDVELVHISKIKPSDTIIFKEKTTTVCKKDIKKSEFLGTTLFGDSFNSGYILVPRVRIPKPI